jgi:hypothetical protein
VGRRRRAEDVARMSRQPAGTPGSSRADAGARVTGAEEGAGGGVKDMGAFADIKNDLPDWPDDVIDQWLLYLANREDTGWPPPNALGTHPWAFILGHRPISWWRDVSWNLESTDCSYEQLCTATKRIVDETIREVTSSTATQSTTRRHRDAFHYILNNATFPSRQSPWRSMAASV